MVINLKLVCSFNYFCLTLLSDRFWAEMSVFTFERAKEIADKEKEQALKSHMHGNNYCASSGFTWVILTTAMAQLALAEKSYMNLAFLAPKGFLRKDVS